jgi:hypothetical protein
MTKLDKKYKQVLLEKEKMRQRIVKLRQRKRVHEVNQKMCKNCGLEYMESENFNWSCRTHRVNQFLF